MYKKFTTFLVATALAVSAQSALAAGDYCTKSRCYFYSLDAHKHNHVYFKCLVDENTTWLKLSDHNVLISGFNISGSDAGKAVFDTRAKLDQLNRHYFDVIADPNRSGFGGLIKSVDIETDGSASCSIIDPKFYPDQTPFSGGYGR